MNIGGNVANNITATLTYQPTILNNHPNNLSPPNLEIKRVGATPALTMEDIYRYNDYLPERTAVPSNQRVVSNVEPMGRNMASDLPINISTNNMVSNLPINRPNELNTNPDVINGYDAKAIQTLESMRKNCQFLSFAYQFILDRNFKFSTQLSIISMISSSAMSIFAGFKLWLGDDKAFQSYSDITMLISNFLIAAVTTASKNYIDDKRNEAIRNYLSLVDQFLGVLHTQLSFDPKYRIPADEFMNCHKETYGKILSDAPNTSLKEIIMAKQRYKLMNYVLENEEPELTTCLCFKKKIAA